MLACPKCGSTYTRELEFCGLDGARLVSTDQDPMIGRTIDRYRITSFIGDGGMARVYRATHVYLDQECAIKILHGDVASDKTLARRFQREAQASSKVKHPNVVTIIDFGASPEGLIFMAMELLVGRTLSEAIHAEAPYPPRRAGSILRQLADGLFAAHAHGFVHRDLKPKNVMMVRDGAREIPKILDFGLVLLLDAAQSDATNLTKAGQVFGTPAYMSPEQITGQSVDHRADLYALGVILYQMLTGTVPFTGTTAQIAVKHLSTEPAPLSDHGGLGPIAMHLLAKKREARPASAADVIAMIDRLDLSISAPSVVLSELPGLPPDLGADALAPLAPVRERASSPPQANSGRPSSPPAAEATAPARPGAATASSPPAPAWAAFNAAPGIALPHAQPAPDGAAPAIGAGRGAESPARKGRSRGVSPMDTMLDLSPSLGALPALELPIGDAGARDAGARDVGVPAPRGRASSVRGRRRSVSWWWISVGAMVVVAGAFAEQWFVRSSGATFGRWSPEASAAADPAREAPAPAQDPTIATGRSPAGARARTAPARGAASEAARGAASEAARGAASEAARGAAPEAAGGASSEAARGAERALAPAAPPSGGRPGPGPVPGTSPAVDPETSAAPSRREEAGNDEADDGDRGGHPARSKRRGDRGRSFEQLDQELGTELAQHGVNWRDLGRLAPEKVQQWVLWRIGADRPSHDELDRGFDELERAIDGIRVDKRLVEQKLDRVQATLASVAGPDRGKEFEALQARFLEDKARLDRVHGEAEIRNLAGQVSQLERDALAVTAASGPQAGRSGSGGAGRSGVGRSGAGRSGAAARVEAPAVVPVTEAPATTDGEHPAVEHAPAVAPESPGSTGPTEPTASATVSPARS